MNSGFQVPDVRPGELILPAWRRLQQEEKSARIMKGRAVRRQQLPGGIALTFDAPSAQWPHPWKATLTGAEAGVREGTVNDLFPTINGVSITGLDEGGKDVGKPRLKITGGPGDNLRSFICVEAVIDLESGFIDEEADEPLIITHRKSTDEDDDTRAVCILAQLLWQDSQTVSRVFQGKHFNLTYELVKATPTTAARHKFT